jgi:hypothetical protein
VCLNGQPTHFSRSTAGVATVAAIDRHVAYCSIAFSASLQHLRSVGSVYGERGIVRGRVASTRSPVIAIRRGLGRYVRMTGNVPFGVDLAVRPRRESIDRHELLDDEASQ